VSLHPIFSTYVLPHLFTLPLYTVISPGTFILLLHLTVTAVAAVLCFRVAALTSGAEELPFDPWICQALLTMLQTYINIFMKITSRETPMMAIRAAGAFLWIIGITKSSPMVNATRPDIIQRGSPCIQTPPDLNMLN